MKNKKIFKSVFSFICFLFIYSSVFAIELPSINKSKIRLFVAPGESGYGEVLVENSTEEPRSMRLYLADWTYFPAANGTKDFPPANTTALSCAAWITFSPAEFTLAPFGRQKVNYSVKVPLGASGGHYAAMFFESVFGRLEEQRKEFKADMNIVIRVATLFYVEPLGTIKRSATINNLSFTPGKKTGTFSMQLDFTNTGNVDITAGGTFHIMDKQGMVYARGEFNDVYTFNGNSAKLSAACDTALLKGKYDLVMTFDLGKALEEDNSGRGPVITKESEIEVSDNGKVTALNKIE